jgi:putative hydrolase of the HAD superfamily
MAVNDQELLSQLRGVRALLLDLDGTLAQTREPRIRLWREIIREGRVLFHVERAMDQLRGRRYSDLDSQLSLIIASKARVPPERVRRVLREVVDGTWPRCFRNIRPPTGISRLLRLADQLQIPRAVVSDHPAIEKLRAMNLLSGWSAIVGLRGSGCLKPLPDGIQMALTQLGVSPNQALFVGDRWDTDGASAARAGVRFLHVTALGPPNPS